MSAASRFESDATQDRATDLRHALLFFLGALAVRAVCLPWVADLPLAADETFYWWFPEIIEYKLDFAVLRPPLWTYMVWGTRALFDEPIAARALSTLFGAATVPFFYLLATRVFDRRTGCVAATLLALYPTHIGFSHYLWAESLFCFLLVSASYLFFTFLANERPGYLYGGALIAGIAILTKAFAIFVFGAFMLTYLTRRGDRKLSRILIACALFAAPALAYSSYATQLVGRRVLLSETGLLNMRLAVGLDEQFEYNPEERAEKSAELAEFIRNRPLSKTLADASKQFKNLWAPTTYTAIRLIPRTRWKTGSPWAYGADPSWGVPLAIFVIGAYLFAVALGLTGLCLSDWSPFKLFSCVALAGLCLTPLLVLEVSRFRISFMWFFLIYAAHLIVSGADLFANSKKLHRILPLIALLALFASVVLARPGAVQHWG